MSKAPDLLVIKARLAATTPGNWTEANYNELGNACHTYVESDNWPICEMLNAPEHVANREFIANSKTDMYALLCYVEFLEEKVKVVDHEPGT